MLARLEERLACEGLPEDGQAGDRDEHREHPQGYGLCVGRALDAARLLGDGERLIDVADRGELALERGEVGRTATEANGDRLIRVDETAVCLEERVREVEAGAVAPRDGELTRHRLDRHDPDRNVSLRRRARAA